VKRLLYPLRRVVHRHNHRLRGGGNIKFTNRHLNRQTIFVHFLFLPHQLDPLEHENRS
jgi:hypothetical protein